MRIFSRAATLAAQRSFCSLRCRWDHNAVCRLLKPVRGNQVPTVGAANERREEAPHPCTNCNREASDAILEQTRISIFSWNPGPRCETPGAAEHHIARRWHIIAPQESIQYLQHDYVTRQFHVNHYNGCAVPFKQTHLQA